MSDLVFFIREVIVESIGHVKEGSVHSSAECGASLEWLIKNGFIRPATEEDIAKAEVSGEVATESTDDGNSEGDGQPTTSEESQSELSETDSNTVSEGEGTGEESSVSEPAVLSEEQAEIVERAKAKLAGGKLRIDNLSNELGVEKELLAGLLTKENGFDRNAQGWYSPIAAE